MADPTGGTGGKLFAGNTVVDAFGALLQIADSVFVAQTVEINWSWGKGDVPELLEALSYNPGVAASAALALWRIGQPAVAALREALSLRDVGKHAQIVLTGIESTAGRTG
jgi:hypothetical protein